MVEYKFKKKKFQLGRGFFINIDLFMVLCIFNFWIFLNLNINLRKKQLLNLVEFMIWVIYLIFLRFKEKNIEPGWVHELSYEFNELSHNNWTIIFFLMLFFFLLISFFIYPFLDNFQFMFQLISLICDLFCLFNLF
jgi:hypothetical protein